MKPKGLLRIFLRSRKEFTTIPHAPELVPDKRRTAPEETWCRNSRPVEPLARIRNAPISLIKSFKEE